LDLARTTPSEFDKELSSNSYNVNGDTKAKAKAFFVKAVQFVEVPISKLLTQRASSSRKKRGVNNKSSEAQETDETLGKNQSNNSQPPANNETSKTILLRGGGQLILSTSINLLTLKGEDRKFVFELIDLLDAYEARTEVIKTDEIIGEPKTEEGTE